MNRKEILIAAKANIEKGWCQGVPAIDAYGNPVLPGAESACAFCILGALRRAGGFTGAVDARNAIAELVPHGLVANWNDTAGRTKEEVLALFDKAIARL